MGGYVAYGFYRYHAPMGSEQTVMIAPRTGAQAVVAQLNAQGLVPPLMVIAAPLFLSGSIPSLKAGEYHFEAGLSPAQVIDRIARGAVVVHKITIVEGWNALMVRVTLDSEPLLSGTLPTSIPEGSVLPETIYFSRGEARSAVLARMQQSRETLLDTLWEKRAPDLPVATKEEALILASIVEKETGVADERPLVAGVFVNRLRQGMMLQSDPTVVYGVEMKHNGASMDRPLSRADLTTDTPYNTYTRTGLPPTPICNPGAKAIEAVLNPQATDALYFVATGTGGHRFAATLAEHEANVAAYRKAMREAGR